MWKIFLYLFIGYIVGSATTLIVFGSLIMKNHITSKLDNGNQRFKDKHLKGYYQLLKAIANQDAQLHQKFGLVYSLTIDKYIVDRRGMALEEELKKEGIIQQEEKE